MEQVSSYFEHLYAQAQWDWKAYVQTFWWIAVIALISYFIFRWIIGRGVRWALRQFKPAWAEIILDHLRINVLTWMAPITIILFFSPTFLAHEAILIQFVQTLLGLWLIIIFLMFIDSIINAAYGIYTTYPISQEIPIKPYVQTAKVFLYSITGLIIISAFIGVSAMVLITGLGALLVGMSFIFKDAALGLVAGIQMAANHMVRLGDWIELPGTSVNGNVVEISLTTVKVRNFDNAVIMVPSYDLVSKQMINWGAMQNSGGRRFKITLPIDSTSVATVSEKQRKQWEKSGLVSPDQDKQASNLAYFRSNITQYLQSHPDINRDYLSMVRDLEVNESGVIVEIYGFTNNTIWKDFESTRSTITEHALSVAQLFNLRLYRAPAGIDWQQLKS